jgi:hypothetical protein
LRVIHLGNFGQFCAESFSQIREETFMAIGVKGRRRDAASAHIRDRGAAYNHALATGLLKVVRAFGSIRVAEFVCRAPWIVEE